MHESQTKDLHVIRGGCSQNLMHESQTKDLHVLRGVVPRKLKDMIKKTLIMPPL